VRYSLFNLTIDSGIPLPLLHPAPPSAPPDLVFREGDVPAQLDLPHLVGPNYQVADGEILLEIRDVARYWIRSGKTVIIERAAASCTPHIALYLLGTVLGALLQQQGIFLLHASAVTGDAGTILFAGNSGSGKSTLTAALVRNGYRLIADDTCMVTLDQGRAIVHPGHPHIKLWRDSLDLLGIAPGGLPRVHAEFDKYHWPVGECFADAPHPVDAFFELSTGPTAVLSRLTGIDRVLALARNTFRSEALNHVAPYTDSITYWTARAGSFPLYHMMRPMDSTSPGGILTGVDEIMTTLKEIPA
jgi:hypothetical protein